MEILHSCQASPVPDGTVADNAFDSPALAVGRHQLTENSPVRKASGIDHNDITGLCQVHSGMEHQVVPLGYPHGKRCTQQLALVAYRLNRRIYRCHTVHVVIDIGHRHILEQRYQLRRGALKVFHNLASNRHSLFLLR